MSALVLALVVAAADASPMRWHQLVAVLQYVEVDYAKALSTRDPEELAEQQVKVRYAAALLLAQGPAGAPYRAELEVLDQRVQRLVAPELVAEGCRTLADRVLREHLHAPGPRAPPDLARGQSLWSQRCAPCHGADGTEAAAGLSPRPTNLRQRPRLTPSLVFATARFGIAGTSMAPSGLGDDDLWAVAFFVSTLRVGACDHPSAPVALDELATSSDEALAAQYGASEVACLRRGAAALPTTVADQLDVALTRSRAGQKDAARAALVDLWATRLRALVAQVEPPRRQRLERAYADARRGERFDANTQLLRVEATGLDRGWPWWSPGAAVDWPRPPGRQSAGE